MDLTSTVHEFTIWFTISILCGLAHRICHIMKKMLLKHFYAREVKTLIDEMIRSFDVTLQNTFVSVSAAAYDTVVETFSDESDRRPKLT